MKKYLFFFAALGWFLAILTNTLAWLTIDIEEYIPFIWLLHIGIFVVWIPVVLHLQKNQEFKESKKASNPFGMLNILLKDAPKWMRIAAISGFVYAFFNFGLFLMSIEGSPTENNGEYSLNNHGRTIKKITEEEYHIYKAKEIRGFSGHWIVFYGIATTVLFKFSGFKKSENDG